MKTAILTEDGAKRIARPELAGETVQYDEIHELGTCVKNVFFGGKRLCGVLSFTGETPGLILVNSSGWAKAN